MEDKIAAIAYIVGEGWVATSELLLKKEEFNKLSLETFSRIVLEFIVFYLHFCDREVFRLVGPEKRDVIMDSVLNKMFIALEKYDESLLVKMFGEKTKNNLAKYFEYWSRASVSLSLREMYNERQLEYASYKELVPLKDKPLKGTLVWEFSKRIATIVRDVPNPVTIVLINGLACDMVVIFAKALRSIFGNT